MGCEPLMTSFNMSCKVWIFFASGLCVALVTMMVAASSPMESVHLLESKHHSPDPSRPMHRAVLAGGKGGIFKGKPFVIEHSFVSKNISAKRGMKTMRGDVLRDFARTIHKSYVSDPPYKHIVIDDFFPVKLVKSAALEIDSFKDWKQRQCSTSIKNGLGGSTDMKPVGRGTETLVEFMQSSTFVSFLSVLTGIENLTIDREMWGAGPFSIPTDGFLSLHTDFNKHVSGGRVVTPGWRRINVLLYLNEGWREHYGGSFELWQTDEGYTGLEYTVKAVPILNRMAIFSVTDVSIHGHLDAVNHPNRVGRKSISMYYYTPTIDDEPLIAPVLHESVYMPEFHKTASKARWENVRPKYVIH